jgi:hypothetical protein
MDPFAPINGISLERYAEIGAALDGKEKDKQATAEVLAAEGVSAADWEAAKSGWTARMQDMSLMGRVATAFMPLYQAALAKRKGGAARISYEDFVHGSALIKIYSFEGMLHATGLTQSEWAEAAGHWTSAMSQNPMQYAGNSGHISTEEQRIRAGTAPRRLQVTRDSSATAMAQPNAQQLYAQASMDPFAAAMQNPAMIQAQQAQAAIMKNPLGFGFGQAAAYMTGGIVAGSRVGVKWSDGNQYAGQVMQAAPGQYLVQFENGAQQWVPENAVVKA